MISLAEVWPVSQKMPPLIQRVLEDEALHDELHPFPFTPPVTSQVEKQKSSVPGDADKETIP